MTGHQATQLLDRWRVVEQPRDGVGRRTGQPFDPGELTVRRHHRCRPPRRS
jgi:hypothetical protein